MKNWYRVDGHLKSLCSCVRTDLFWIIMILHSTLSKTAAFAYMEMRHESLKKPQHLGVIIATASSAFAISYFGNRGGHSHSPSVSTYMIFSSAIVLMCSLWLLRCCSRPFSQTGPKWSSQRDGIYFMKITITTQSSGSKKREAHANWAAMNDDHRSNQTVITLRIITTKSH